MKGVLIKRLESSFYAFRQTLSRFIHSSERFIDMLDSGTVYISKTVDVYELLDNDDLDSLENLVEDERAQKYAQEDFSDRFRDDLLQDLELLRRLTTLWDTVTEDPKLDHFLSLLRSHAILGNNKLVVFTESKETGDYLFEALNAQCPGKVLFFSSRGGQFGAEAQAHNNAISREMIRANFDPNEKEQEDTIRILLTTDILAEGINLHRSNALVNYDLPWNPTRVLQRAGRVNRLGSEHDDVHIFNFFPTTQADEHLGLETNILNKIQMFHHILGEDARYLSDGEEFGSQELFDTLNRKSTYTGEDGEADSELQYLDMMRKLRDEDPDLFERIKRLPKKARSGTRVKGLEQQQLLTFFRIGKLKKFYLNRDGAANEVTFFDAASLAACDPDTPRTPIPENYFHLLETNKQRFDQDTLQREEPESKSQGGRSNIKYVEMRLKDPGFLRCRKFTEIDEEFVQGVRGMIQQGTIAKKIAQSLKRDLEKTVDPLEMLTILRKHIRVIDDVETPQQTRAGKREIILSMYQQG